MPEPDYETVEAVDEHGRHVTRVIHYGPPATDTTMIATGVLDELRAVVARVVDLHSGPRTARPGSGCVQCGIVWPCPTKQALDGHDRPGMVTLRWADLDLVMNGDPTQVGDYQQAVKRIRDALTGRKGEPWIP